MDLTLAEVAADVGGRVAPEAEGLRATGCSIDSRTVGAGDLFFAIRGPRFDGHDFVGAARLRGAIAAVVARDWEVSEPELPCIAVGSPTAALQALARAVRQRWGRVVIGVTGSVGKTTTKEMIATLLEKRFRVLRSRGNLNNELGLPLSLLDVRNEHEVAVVEMGMSAAGEIRHLTEIALPNEGVVTNVNPVHLEFFDSIEGIAAAKAELIEGLVGDKIAYLSADDARVRRMGHGFDGKVVTWGMAEDATFRVIRSDDLGLDGSAFTIRHRDREVDFMCPLPGLHNISNAAAAIGVAITHGIEWESVRDSVRDFSITGLRGVVRRYEEGFVVVDDSYNSNPAALKEMIRLVAGLQGFRRRILVAGEMLELGTESPALHADCGRVAREAGIDLIVGVQGAARDLLAGARGENVDPDSLVYRESADEAGQLLAGIVRSGDVILLKGSRGVGLEQVSEILNRQFRTVER